MKKVVILLLVAIVLMSAIPVTAGEREPQISVEGTFVEFPDAMPFIDENDRTQVPVGALAEILGFETDWDPQSKTATVSRGETVVRITEGEKAIRIDNEMQEMDTAALLRDDRMYIPLRYVAEAFGFTVNWDQKTGAVDLVSGSNEENRNNEYQQTGSKSFDFTLLNEMPNDKNYMISPFSLKMALAMAANGAQGDTLDEILFAIGAEDITEYNDYALQFIKNSNETETVELNMANSIWLNEDHGLNSGLGFSQSFETVIKEYYGGLAGNINNRNGAKTVNDWVAQQTKDTIKSILNDQHVQDNVAFLVNTIYFKGEWARTFDGGESGEGTFTDRTGKEKRTSFMRQTANHNYYEDENFIMLEKPYKGNSVAMYIVLPKHNAGSEFVLEQELFSKAISQMENKRVNLRLPKFKTESTHEGLVSILETMGIKTVFNQDKADLQSMFNMAPSQNIFITQVLQKTFIEVGEEGTEASAATAVSFGATSAPIEEPVDFICDRPFTYFIMHKDTGEILFMGEYAFVE